MLGRKPCSFSSPIPAGESSTCGTKRRRAPRVATATVGVGSYAAFVEGVRAAARRGDVENCLTSRGPKPRSMRLALPSAGNGPGAQAVEPSRHSRRFKGEGGTEGAGAFFF